MSLIVDYQRTKVALIKKKKAPPKLPEMLNKWNAIGGKFDPQKDKSHRDTALREFNEETGVILNPDGIFQFGDIYMPNKYMHCSLWTGLVDGNTQLKQMTIEPVAWHSLDNLPNNMVFDVAEFIADALDALDKKQQHQTIAVKQYLQL